MPEIAIAAEPLSASVNVHPNVLLSLSLDISSVGIAYRDHLGAYDRSEDYFGYFNPRLCYEYMGGNRNTRDGYFSVKKSADTNHECGGNSFSGNFMNWASHSTLDILRYALTGGDRVIDSVAQTVLQRAVLPEEFYAHAIYFPRRSITRGVRSGAPKQVTPFNVDTLYIVSCRNRILFSDSATSDNHCDTPAHGSNGSLLHTDKRLGEYLVRVSVCDAADGLMRPDFCQRYGSRYKPVGEIQKHARKTRFAVMGYLLDDAVERYGGVLRVPMKHVGPTQIGADLSERVNEHLEWDPDTGVLHLNPQDPNKPLQENQKSGLLNYLNQFGRDGKYKINAPLSELYYEGLRYLQGKQATSNATIGMVDRMKDGFHVLDKWEDPIAAACQKTSIVSIADADAQWDRYLPGNRRSSYNGGTPAHDATRATERVLAGKTPALDAVAQTARVGEMELDRAGLYANPAPRAGMIALQNKDTGELGRGSYYMAGLAYWANTNDLRLDKPLRVKTFAIDLDAGGNGTMDGSPRAVHPRESQLYLAAKYGGFDDRNRDANPFITLGEDGRTDVRHSNAEWDESGQGVPGNYFLAGQPRDLIDALRKVFSTVAQQAARGGDALPRFTLSSNNLSSDEAFVYQAGFNPARWSGSLTKRALALDAAGAVTLAATADWDAAEILSGNEHNAAHPAPDVRRIFTARRNAKNGLMTVPFQWHALGSEQQALLSLSPDSRSNDGLGEKRLQYLRGSRELELGKPRGIFRQRDRILGDIIHSTPVHMAAPQMAVPDLAYQGFKEQYRVRNKAVYVGANDGMLHAFDASSGVELFAYVPHALFENLSQLSAPGYVHRAYMDGEIGVGDALVSGKWKTVLAAGMGGGAQGVIALDVTDPRRFEEGGGALFEFTDRDDSDIGNFTGSPHIAKLKVKTIKGVPEYAYFVIVASGLNNAKDDGAGKFSKSGQAALFLLSLDKQPATPWKLGVNYYKLKLPLSDPSLPNGVIAPALVLGGDGALRLAYTADLQGNVWRLDFSAGAPWTKVLGTHPDTPLFTATDGRDRRQPITVQPRVVFAPGGYLVLFGTGKFLEDADAAVTSFTQQSFYAVHDNGDASGLTRKDLAMRQLTAATHAHSNAIDIVDESAHDASLATQGWYFDFMDAEKIGERSVTAAQLGYGKVFFNTLIPARDPCGSASGRSYGVEVMSGLAPSGAPTGFLSKLGVMGMPRFLDTAVEIGSTNPLGKKRVKRKHSIFNPGSTGSTDDTGSADPVSGNTRSVTVPAGRLSWREVINWQELHDEANKK